MRVINQDPAFTNHQNKKRKEYQHNQLRLHLLFGPSNPSQQKLDAREEKTSASLTKQKNKKKSSSPDQAYHSVGGGKKTMVYSHSLRNTKSGFNKRLKHSKSERLIQSLKTTITRNRKLDRRRGLEKEPSDTGLPET